MARTVLADEEKMCIKALALELADIRRQLDALAEAMVKINDKQFFRIFNVCREDFSENQLDNYKLALQKQSDAAENEFR